MPTAELNKHAQKTKETREQLLCAAQVVFARDGFEAADLAEIAAMAGRTRGAIYAQFKSKEDVFLALMEERTEIYRARMGKAIAGSKDTAQNLAAYRQFCIDLTEEHDWALLMLEFKLFAMRHPETMEQLQSQKVAALDLTQEERLASILGPSDKEKGAPSRHTSVLFVQALIHAITVEGVYFSAEFKKKTLKQVAERVFDALMPPPKKK